MHALFVICAIAGLLIWVAGWLPEPGAAPATPAPADAAPASAARELPRLGVARRMIALALLGFGAVGLSLVLAGRETAQALGWGGALGLPVGVVAALLTHRLAK
jgi:hypothetical protein